MTTRHGDGLGHDVEGTTEERAPSVRAVESGQPGVLATLVAGAPFFRAQPVGDEPLVVGRGVASKFVLEDVQLSRRHLTIAFEEDAWIIEELGSRNGTYVNGVRIEGTWRGRHARSIRAGQTVLILERDLARLARPHGLYEAPVVGPSLQVALERIAHTARAGRDILITGETGAGKELAAEAFHKAAHVGAPFRKLNCAAVAEQLLESELFGYAKGAFSGASQARAGLFEAAHGGTLLLDELGEMSLAMQAKILRAVQHKEVRRIGESELRRVNLRVVSATNRDLLERVHAGLFREDLYYRLAQNVVHIPALRDRPEEMSFLIALGLEGELKIDSSLVDQCLLRPWPGNVRELLAAVRSAASTAGLSGLSSVAAGHLPSTAGLGARSARAALPEPTALPSASDSGSAASSGASEPAPRRVLPREDRDGRILAAFRLDPRADIAVVAASEGVNVATVYRVLQRHRARKG